MNDYTHLYSVADGATGVPLRINMVGAKMGGGGVSGHVPEGRYALQVVSVKVASKGDNAKTPGVNFVFNQKTVGPKGYEGVDLITYVPQPQHMEIEHDKTHARWTRMMLSALSGANPQAYQQLLQNGQIIDITSDFFVGKTFFVYIRDGKGQYADRSEIAYYLSKEEYDASPGPVRKFPTAGTGAGGATEIGIVGGAATAAPAQGFTLPQAAPVVAGNGSAPSVVPGGGSVDQISQVKGVLNLG